MCDDNIDSTCNILQDTGFTMCLEMSQQFILLQVLSIDNLRQSH